MAQNSRAARRMQLRRIEREVINHEKRRLRLAGEGPTYFRFTRLNVSVIGNALALAKRHEQTNQAQGFITMFIPGYTVGEDQ